MEQKFQDFLMSVPAEEQGIVLELDKLFREHGCEYDIKEAKQGYLVSYLKKIDKKKVTIVNFVFRKTGVKIRIYAANIPMYQSILERAPKKMKEEIIKAGDCKRLYDPNACNPKCQMGYTFIMDGEEYKKCRNMAFMPTLCKENDEYIIEFVQSELLEMSKKSS
ncbi:MAG TPA: hypothetical protein VJZ06_02980 [Mobilitalea sp.]|nr:hypothetical protein [Mobilitalea sp.]